MVGRQRAGAWRWRLTVAGVLGVLVVGVGVAWPREPGRASALTNCDVADTGVGLDSVEAHFLVLLNDYRASLSPPAAQLTIDSRLNRAAHWHANDMKTKGYFDHGDSLGRNPYERLVDCGYPPFGYSWAEIILKGASNAGTALQMWQGSPLHDAAMRNPAFRSAGIAKVGSYWVVDFSSLAGDGNAGEPDRPSPPASAGTATSPQPTNTPQPTAMPTKVWYQSFATGSTRE